MSDRVILVKGKLRQNISAFEYSFRKDDMNGWEVEREAPPVPEEVKERMQITSPTGPQSTKINLPGKPRKK